MTDLKHLIDKKITETFYISKPPTAQVKYAKYTARSTTARRKQPVDIELGKDETVLMQALRGPKELAKPKPRHQSAGMSQALENSLQSDPWKSHKKIALAQHPLLIEAIKAW